MPRQQLHIPVTFFFRQESMRLILEIATAIALTFAAILAFAKGAHAGDMMVMNAVAEASKVPTARAGAVYVDVMNHGTESDQLVAITTEAAEQAVVHKSVDADGVMRMEEVPALAVAPGQTLSTVAEGYHIMLTGLKAPLKTGETVTLKLKFEQAGEIEVQAAVGTGVKLNHEHNSP
jgi:periplasmic copper chaperone A